MKNKENKVLFYAVFVGLFLFGWIFTTSVVSINSLGVWPIAQLLFMCLLMKYGKQMAGKPYALFALLCLFFCSMTDLVNLMPVIAFIFAVLIHKTFMPLDSVTIENLFQLKPLYYLVFLFFFYRPLSLLINILLIKKGGDVTAQSNKELDEFAALQQEKNKNKVYDCVRTGYFGLTQATGLVTIFAKELDLLKGFTFILKDRASNSFEFKSGKSIVTSKDCSIEGDGRFLLIEKPQSVSLLSRLLRRKSETFVYCFDLTNVNPLVKDRIYEICRFEK